MRLGVRRGHRGPLGELVERRQGIRRHAECGGQLRVEGGGEDGGGRPQGEERSGRDGLGVPGAQPDDRDHAYGDAGAAGAVAVVSAGGVAGVAAAVVAGGARSGVA